METKIHYPLLELEPYFLYRCRNTLVELMNDSGFSLNQISDSDLSLNLSREQFEEKIRQLRAEQERILHEDKPAKSSSKSKAGVVEEEEEEEEDVEYEQSEEDEELDEEDEEEDIEADGEEDDEADEEELLPDNKVSFSDDLDPLATYLGNQIPSTTANDKLLLKLHQFLEWKLFLYANQDQMLITNQTTECCDLIQNLFPQYIESCNAAGSKPNAKKNQKSTTTTTSILIVFCRQYTVVKDCFTHFQQYLKARNISDGILVSGTGTNLQQFRKPWHMITHM